MAWAEFPEASLTVLQGAPKTINSSGTAMRSFCGDLGTGLFYRNARILPGLARRAGRLEIDLKPPPSMCAQTGRPSTPPQKRSARATSDGFRFRGTARLPPQIPGIAP